MSAKTIKKHREPTVTDAITKKVEIKLPDGETYPIVLTHNALIQVEDLTGLNVLTGEVNLGTPSFKLLRAILYVVLKRAGSKYSLTEVGDLIHPGNIPVIAHAFRKAWEASMPEPEPKPESKEDEEEEENPTEATAE